MPRTIFVLRSLSCDLGRYEKVGNISGPDLNHMVRFLDNPDTGAKIQSGYGIGSACRTTPQFPAVLPWHPADLPAEIPTGTRGPGGAEMKMAPGGRMSIDLSRGGLVAGRPGRFWIPGGTMPPPCFLKSDGGTVLLAWGVPPAPYKKKSPALVGPGFPDPNAYESFFSFRQHKPACKSRYLPSAFIVLGI